MSLYMVTSLFSYSDGKKQNASSLFERADAVKKERITNCPKLKIIDHYALLDRYETIDIVDSESREEVEIFVDLIRKHGKAQAYIIPVIKGSDFEESKLNGKSVEHDCPTLKR